MTYCVAVRLDAGLVFLSDSRTYAGVDHINTYRKMYRFERTGDRAVVLMTAGNLSITQSVINGLQEAVRADNRSNLFSAATMFEIARLVGDALREVYARDSESLREFGVDFSVGLIVGGQIRGETPRLFNIYSAGNFTEATPETPYLQIGESKYGKPILDRIVHGLQSLDEAAKCVLISMDSSIRSNLSVGLPLDLLVYERDSLSVAKHCIIGDDNAYYAMIRKRWGNGLQQVFDDLPPPDWRTMNLTAEVLRQGSNSESRQTRDMPREP